MLVVMVWTSCFQLEMRCAVMVHLLNILTSRYYNLIYESCHLLPLPSIIDILSFLFIFTVLITSSNLRLKQGKEVNLFQPAREFLPMIDEVVYLFL